MFSISKKLIQKIERLQKISFYIILEKKSNHDYSANMKKLETKSLEERRMKLAKKFAVKVLKHPEHRNIFSFNNARTRSNRKIIVPMTKTARYRQTTVPSLAHIINTELTHRI